MVQKWNRYVREVIPTSKSVLPALGLGDIRGNFDTIFNDDTGAGESMLTAFRKGSLGVVQGSPHGLEIDVSNSGTV